MTKKQSIEEKKQFFYREKIDPLIVKVYTNKYCIDCKGKGFIVSELPPEGLKYFIKGIKNQQVYQHCPCIDKNIRKQRREQAK